MVLDVVARLQDRTLNTKVLEYLRLHQCSPISLYCPPATFLHEPCLPQLVNKRINCWHTATCVMILSHLCPLYCFQLVNQIVRVASRTKSCGQKVQKMFNNSVRQRQWFLVTYCSQNRSFGSCTIDQIAAVFVFDR